MISPLGVAVVAGLAMALVPAAASAGAPLTLEQIGDVTSTVCLAAPVAGGPVRVAPCDASDPRQMWILATVPRVRTAAGLCLTATARKRPWAMRCGRLGQRWWWIVSGSGFDSRRYPRLCLSGPALHDQLGTGRARLARCGGFNTAEAWMFFPPPQTVS